VSGLLGQLAPTPSAWFDLYTCPANTVATLRVIVTNRVAVSTFFRVAASANGDAIADLHALAYDKAIGETDTGTTIAFVLSGGDVVRVYSGNGNLSFTATGETRPE